MMKKTIPCMVLLIGCVFSMYSLVFSSPLVTVKAESGSKEIFINGKPFSLKAPVKIKDGTHIVRLKKELFTTLGVKYLEWDKENMIYVQLSRGAEKIVLEIQKGRKEIKVKSNGSDVSITPVPTLEYPSVFVPLEPLYELLGFFVSGAPQTIVQKTKPENKNTVKKKIEPVKEKEAETAKTPETQPEVTAEPVTPEKMAEPVTEETQTEGMQTVQTAETVTAKTPEEAKPASSTLPQTKAERFHVDFGYSLLAPAHVKFSNGGLEGRISYIFPKMSDASVTLSYASHTWTSVYPATGQEANLRANVFTANLNYSLTKLYRASRPWLNAWHVTGGYAQFSTLYEPNVTLGLASQKQTFSGFNIGMGVKFLKIFNAEYRYFAFPKVSLGFRSLDASYAEQVTFSLMPLTF